ncbi:MAG: DUF3791 domain-containing protein [Clostridia bacterium]|nr:DUF3791 domain-containing protein [Clostridia bacterium]
MGLYEDRYLANKIYLMYVISNGCCKAHDMTAEQFLELDKQCDIIGFIAECPEYIDWMTRDEMLETIEEYIQNRTKKPE